MTELNAIKSGANLDWRRDAPLFQTAQKLEASFLAEMLKISGVSKSRSEFGGGFGEEAFADQLNKHYAKALVDRGGLGLAESIYRSMLAKG
jgi:Rod binding domain-containing protein